MFTKRADGESGARACIVALIVIVAVGAALRFWGLRFGLPHPFARTDEEVLVDSALYVLRDGHPRFFDWPTLFINLTAGAYASLFAVERTIGGSITHASVAKASFEPVLHLIPRVMSATTGVLTIVALYGAARELFSRGVAVLAAACLALAFLHVRDSHFGVTDVPATFLMVCAFWAAVRCATRGPTYARVVVTGVLCGLAASTKYNAAAIALPAAWAIVFPFVPTTPRAVGPAIRALALLGLCATVAFLIGTPFAILDWRSFAAAVDAVRNHLASGHVVGERGWIYHAVFTLRYGLGLPLLAASLVGAVWMIARERRTAALVLVFPVAYYVVLGTGLTVFTRYMTPIVPFLCLTAAYGLDRLSALAAARVGDGRARVMVAVALTAVVLAPTAASSWSFDRLMARVDTRVLGGEWIVAQYPAGATIYQNGLGVGHLLPTPRMEYTEARFNYETGGFDVHGQPAPALPDLIVFLESPLVAYSQVPREIRAIVARDYRLAATFDGVPAEGVAGALYDQEDAFFAPFAGIDRVERPGPHVSIFVRRPGDAR